MLIFTYICTYADVACIPPYSMPTHLSLREVRLKKSRTSGVPVFGRRLHDKEVRIRITPRSFEDASSMLLMLIAHNSHWDSFFWFAGCRWSVVFFRDKGMQWRCVYNRMGWSWVLILQFVDLRAMNSPVLGGDVWSLYILVYLDFQERGESVNVDDLWWWLVSYLEMCAP